MSKFRAEAAVRIDNPTLNAKAIVPDWGSKELRLGTLHSIVKDLGFDWEEFNKA